MTNMIIFGDAVFLWMRFIGQICMLSAIIAVVSVVVLKLVKKGSDNNADKS